MDYTTKTGVDDLSESKKGIQGWTEEKVADKKSGPLYVIEDSRFVYSSTKTHSSPPY